MKKFAYVFTAALILCSCSDEESTSFINDATLLSQNDMTLITDQATLSQRMVFTPADGTTSARRVMHSASQHETQPVIPADALPLKDQPTNWNNGVTLSANGKYYVAAGETFKGSVSINNAGDGIDIYIAGNAETDLLWWNGGQKVNIYVLEGATYKYALDGYDNKAHLRNGTTIKCWGSLDVVNANYGLTIKEGAALYLYQGSMSQFVVHNGVDMNYGSAFQVEGTFYTEVPIWVEGSAMFNGGDSYFVKAFHIVGNCWMKNNAKVTIEDCSTVEKLTWFDGAATIEVLQCMFQTGNLNTIDHSGAHFRLYKSLLQVDENAYIDDQLNVNGLPTIVGLDDYSVFNVDGTLYIDGTNGGGSYTWNSNHEIEGLALKSVAGFVDLYYGQMRNGNMNWKPEDTEWNKYGLGEGNVVLEEGVLVNGGTYLEGKDGCCGSFGTKPVANIVEVMQILPPAGEHRFSATGLDFNGDLLYLGWHSNPKFEDAVGGYMDVIKVDKYDARASLFEQSLFSNEMRYNHTMYHDGIIYAPATSTKVGAAMAEISVGNDGMIDAAPIVRRINLYGGSANCVALIENRLLTISGWSEGALQSLTMNAARPDQTYHEGNYMGKYVFHNAAQHEVVVLHDTDNGQVDIYSDNGDFSAPVRSFKAGSLVPKDGKNVCISDDQYIYVCRGVRGLSIFNRQGQLVASTNTTANGVDVDDDYIYVAAGFGVAVYDKKNITGTDPVVLTPVARNVMTEKTNLQDPTNSQGVSAQIGASANFIRKGADGRLYVAYGVYGLRIYELKR